MRGADKLLEEVGGEPLLTRLARAGLAAGLTVIVTLPEPAGARGEALAGLDVLRVPVPDAAEGMAASIRAGLAACPEDPAGLMILPADMPEIDAADLALLAEAFAEEPERVMRGAGEDGTPGHPVIFPRRLFPALAALRGDEGARRALKGEHVRLVPLPGRHALTDLDTPEEWAAWRAGRSG
ncbi:CTP:molybdopterin cytidylyltransferase MocA [Meinhardsimonia xiamenensis]|jgi:CTP:molybdopterin cytidylyltransferase MocA|uniref:CTP:molybdopterin cytidylyltransferase MocA n=1 Tax=Meinhardsimonia xiamenensis TaxID=990712 RepID=A0A1G9H2X1_9RHOB|nr:CTP:molybdopterin cytidylyltransferase MocA [Meinhardsimonia xiamenensis]SDL07298.1 CTP:molybdopterin cytidylyltransferase MocA [Meinhardsimonia xiamenensis]